MDSQQRNLFSLLFLALCFWKSVYAYAPEDSNYQYLLDKQIAHYFHSWDVVFDSTTNGIRTSQGCLDVLNWYIDLELRCEAQLSKLLGIRYKNLYVGDYDQHISNHYFQPFFQLSSAQRLFLSITTHYYKGEDEIGIGYFWGSDYINYLELFFSVENFDRNFSLQHMPEGRTKTVYKNLEFPMKLTGVMTRNWNTGRLRTEFSLGRKYFLESTDEPVTFREQGYQHYWYLRMFQDINRLRFGIHNVLKYSYKHTDNFTDFFQEKIFDIYPEMQFAYRINKRWVPNLYLNYNYKCENDTSLYESGFYERNVFAYLLDVEFCPGKNFVWHFGTQREFYRNNQGVNLKDRRINVGLEYRYQKIWFYLVEAMEGDFPTPKYLHNHTYLQLMIRF